MKWKLCVQLGPQNNFGGYKFTCAMNYQLNIKSYVEVCTETGMYRDSGKVKAACQNLINFISSDSNWDRQFSRQYLLELRWSPRLEISVRTYLQKEWNASPSRLTRPVGKCRKALPVSFLPVKIGLSLCNDRILYRFFTYVLKFKNLCTLVYFWRQWTFLNLIIINFKAFLC